MSVVVLQAIVAVFAVVTFAAAVRLQSRARTVTFAFPQELEPGRHTATREPALV